MDSMDNFRERFEALEQRTEPLQPPPRLVARRRRWGWGLAWGVGLLALGLSILEGMAMAQAQSPPCSPTAYTQVTNSAPFPSTFCAYAWSPYRNRLPDNPQSIDAANTQTLQHDYAPNSGPTQLNTIGALPTGPNQGDDGYAVFVAAASDPRVTVNCAQVQRYYGCSDSDGHSLAQVTDTYQIPAWVRPSVAFDEEGNPGGD